MADTYEGLTRQIDKLEAEIDENISGDGSEQEFDALLEKQSRLEERRTALSKPKATRKPTDTDAALARKADQAHRGVEGCPG